MSSESIVISDTDDDPEISVSRSNSKKRGLKSKRRRINSPNLESSRNENWAEEEKMETHFTVERKNKVEQKITGLEVAHATEIYARMSDWINKMK